MARSGFTDAMGCQVSIARQIREDDGDSLLGIKENQLKLGESLSGGFMLQRSDPIIGLEMAKQYSRIEARAY